VTKQELSVLVKGFSPVIRRAIERAIAPLEARIAELEARPTLKYCGVWQSGTKYEAGACCTHQGSLWVCKAATITRPGDALSQWTLAVKRGRDGKDGKDAA
jgi:hypothetical protein